MLLPVSLGDGERAALSLAGRVRERLQRPLALPQHAFFVDASIGLALHPESGGQPEELLRAAQAAMHEAKRVPGLSVQLARPGFERGSGLSLAAEQALRAGLHNEEFVLVFQPKVAAADGRLTGFEALARWQRPAGAPAVGPAEFIPAAERTGLIGALGALIMDKACAQVAEWMAADEPLVPVAVNVSPLQLLDPAFPGLVARCMALHRVPPHALAIEITETAAAMHLESARERLAEFNVMSLQVALDDFGAGVSSLNILRSLPLHVVKIDRLLIEPLPAPDAVAVVRAVCQLAGALRLAVVAGASRRPSRPRPRGPRAATRCRATTSAGRCRPARRAPGCSAPMRARRPAQAQKAARKPRRKPARTPAPRRPPRLSKAPPPPPRRRAPPWRPRPTSRRSRPRRRSPARAAPAAPRPRACR